MNRKPPKPVRYEVAVLIVAVGCTVLFLRGGGVKASDSESVTLGATDPTARKSPFRYAEASGKCRPRTLSRQAIESPLALQPEPILRHAIQRPPHQPVNAHHQRRHHHRRKQ
jgi:hypothetical protein